MNFYREIQSLTEEELETRIQEKIQILEEQSLEENGHIDTIGYKLDYNPVDYHITEEEYDRFSVEVRCFYTGYIRKGMRMVYGMGYDEMGFASNQGQYYYIDEDDYIGEFCKFIKGKEIINEYELFEYILDFIRNYFGTIPEVSREEMFTMIQKTDRVFYAPVKEHALSWFKKKGNAMCSEYAILVQNILSVFDIDSYLVMGSVETGEDTNGHVFHLISFTEEESKEKVNALIDFANFTTVLDYNFQKIGETPYIIYLEKLDEDFIKEFVGKKTHIVEKDYSYMILGEEIVQIGYDRNRDYYIEDQMIFNQNFQKRK